MRVASIFAVAVFAVIALPAGAQQRAAPGTRIAGTIRSVSAGRLILSTAKGDRQLALTPQTRVFVRKPASISEIKPGAYLGTANQNSATGNDAGTATEVHLADNGPDVNAPMNDSGLTMTNGHVTAVTPTAGGLKMNINYGQSTTRDVLVSKDTAITRMEDIGAAALKPGLQVNVMASPGPDGKLAASFVLVGPAPAAARP